MLNRFVFVYLDDILSFSKSREEHTQPVQAVLQRFLENSLFVKSTCPRSFLGYIIAQGWLQMDPAKVSDWPIPESQKQLQCFQGFLPLIHQKLQLSGCSTHQSD